MIWARLADSLAVGCAAAAAVLLVGCGERPQVINYKQGTYQGKPDQPAWDSAKFNGDRTAYDLAIKQRNQSQNEYKRM
jgi:major membrane immunogen (membrane-anchored lipoprotein)